MSANTWIEKLKVAGVKAAHPDDGCVNRDENEIRFRYPSFFDNPCIGNVIALGNHESFRLVSIVSVRKSVPGYLYYRFRPIVKVVIHA